MFIHVLKAWPNVSAHGLIWVAIDIPKMDRWQVWNGALLAWPFYCLGTIKYDRTLGAFEINK